MASSRLHAPGHQPCTYQSDRVDLSTSNVGRRIFAAVFQPAAISPTVAHYLYVVVDVGCGLSPDVGSACRVNRSQWARVILSDHAWPHADGHSQYLVEAASLKQEFPSRDIRTRIQLQRLAKCFRGHNTTVIYEYRTMASKTPFSLHWLGESV